MAVQLLYWVLFWDLLCFCIRDVTCLCNITCTTDYERYLECQCANVPQSSIGLEANCSGEYDGEVIAILSSCELRPPQSSCKMQPEDFFKIVSADTNCTVRVIYPLGPSTDPLGPTKDPLGPSTDLLGLPPPGVVESNSWFLGDIVKPLPPSNLRVTHHGGRVNLTWEVDSYKHCLSYRVRIRDPTQVRSFELLQQYLAMDASSLPPSFRSQADVQACLCPESYLKGPWSAWSPAVDLTEVLVPVGGEIRLVLCVAVPALLCVIALCYVSKPFFTKKVQFLMFVPDPGPFFKPLRDKYDGNFKEWVHPAFSEEEVLRVAAVPASDQKLLPLSHHGNHIRRPGERACAVPGLLSLRTVVLSGFGGDGGPPEIRGRGGGGTGGAGPPPAPGAAEEEEGGDVPAEASSPAPRPSPLGGPRDPWDDDYPRVDLDTVDSGFGESACSSPVSSEHATAAEAGFFPPDERGKSNYIRQWMDRQQPPPPAEQHHRAEQNQNYEA
ncbi:interleukin 21 receptor, tandem duplicate 1 [Gadus chalcogrammus]|uniref:interleukin 21 receptor, tandem duplicate 1 n=1 Tax=Gadus chalcogrammus TaxID=1042646 RepID=UPI0024C232EF|nr:interleukin 21 receptor, tandem duplicate 1 [Gadus chalcogrammus]